MRATNWLSDGFRVLVIAPKRLWGSMLMDSELYARLVQCRRILLFGHYARVQMRGRGKAQWWWKKEKREEAGAKCLGSCPFKVRYVKRRRKIQGQTLKVGRFGHSEIDNLCMTKFTTGLAHLDDFWAGSLLDQFNVSNSVSADSLNAEDINYA